MPKRFTVVLYILASIWVLCAPNAGQKSPFIVCFSNVYARFRCKNDERFLAKRPKIRIFSLFPNTGDTKMLV